MVARGMRGRAATEPNDDRLSFGVGSQARVIEDRMGGNLMRCRSRLEVRSWIVHTRSGMLDAEPVEMGE
jgi:hypothetical protein